MFVTMFVTMFWFLTISCKAAQSSNMSFVLTRKLLAYTDSSLLYDI